MLIEQKHQSNAPESLHNQRLEIINNRLKELGNIPVKFWRVELSQEKANLQTEKTIIKMTTSGNHNNINEDLIRADKYFKEAFDTVANGTVLYTRGKDTNNKQFINEGKRWTNGRIVLLNKALQIRDRALKNPQHNFNPPA